MIIRTVKGNKSLLPRVPGNALKFVFVASCSNVIARLSLPFVCPPKCARPCVSRTDGTSRKQIDEISVEFRLRI